MPVFPHSRRTVSILPTWPRRILISARRADDVHTHTKGPLGVEHKVASLGVEHEVTSLEANELVDSFPQSDQPAGPCGPFRSNLAKLRVFNHVAGHDIDRRILSTIDTCTQAACILVQLAYEICHHGSAAPSLTATEACSHFESSLSPSLRFLSHTSTPWFVVAALTHGALASHQYHLHGSDRHQELCLGVGVVIGLIASVPSLADPSGGIKIVSKLAIAVTFALAMSAVGHYIASLVCRQRNIQAGIPDAEWADEKREFAGVV